VEPWR